MRRDPLLVRLAAANPVPAPEHVSPSAAHPRRPLVALVAAVAVAVPAAAFADDIAGLLGLSNQGTPVPTSSVTDLTQATQLNDAMQELGFPSTLSLLGTRDGISFYAARNASGHFCFAIDTVGEVGGKGVGCMLGDRDFPSAQLPIIDFSRWGHRLAGFAADGVATVQLVDAGGTVVASAPVEANIYADATVVESASGIRALDAHAHVLYQRSFDQAP